MNFIKNMIVLGLVLLLSTQVAIAQRAEKMDNAEAFAQTRTDRMTRELSLNEAQATQVKTINLDFANKMKAAKGNSTDRAATKATTKALREEHSAALKAVLTTEQMAKLESTDRPQKKEKKKLKQKEKGKKKAMREEKTPEDRAAKQTEKLSKNLTLSEEQTVQVQAINLDYTQKLDAARTGDASKEVKKAAMKKLKAEKMEQMKAVLTAEQFAKMAADKQAKKEQKKMKKMKMKEGKKMN